MSRTVLKIDITDWDEEYLEKEQDLGTLEKTIAYQQETGAKTLEVARLLTVAKLRGDNEEEVLKEPPKTHVMMGAANDYARQVVSKKRAVKLNNGNTVSVRQYMGEVTEYTDDDADIEPKPLEETRLITSEGAEAKNRAIKYIKNQVPGYIRGRLVIVAANGSADDVKEIAKQLKREIDAMVQTLI